MAEVPPGGQFCAVMKEVNTPKKRNGSNKCRIALFIRLLSERVIASKKTVFQPLIHAETAGVVTVSRKKSAIRWFENCNGKVKLLFFLAGYANSKRKPHTAAVLNFSCSRDYNKN